MTMNNDFMNQIREDASKCLPKNYNASVDFINDATLNPEALQKVMENPESVTERELEGIFRVKYPEILERCASEGSHPTSKIFITEYSLRMFTAILSNYQISYRDRINVNRIVKALFDYYECEGCFPNEKEIVPILKNDLLGLVNAHNARAVAAAVPELGYEHALMIAMHRHSHSSEAVSYEEVNKYLLRLPVEIMTPQNIIRIYENLGAYCPISISTLLSVVMIDQSTTLFKPLKAKDEKQIEGNLLYAVMAILNECPIEIIRKTIMKYNMEYSAYKPKAKGPISEIAQMFPRVNWTVMQLRSEGNEIY